MNEVLPFLKYDPMKFLLGTRQPAWVKYQTLRKVLNKSDNDPDVVYWKEKRDTSAIVSRIRERQMPDGSFPCLPWMHIHKYDFHQLVEMGFTIEDISVRRASENLLDYQLPNGGYMHPTGRKVNVPNPEIGWAACVTGYVTYALMRLGFRHDPRVETVLRLMLREQRYSGGWICDNLGPCPRHYCILSGTPWVFRCLAEAGLIDKDSRVTKQALKLFRKHKKKIIRHGYQKDRYYRCDEALLLSAFSAVGLSAEHDLPWDFQRSLLNRQQPDGSWLFSGKSSAWYTLEALDALLGIDNQIMTRSEWEK